MGAGGERSGEIGSVAAEEERNLVGLGSLESFVEERVFVEFWDDLGKGWRGDWNHSYRHSKLTHYQACPES